MLGQLFLIIFFCSLGFVIIDIILYALVKIKENKKKKNTNHITIDCTELNDKTADSVCRSEANNTEARF